MFFEEWFCTHEVFFEGILPQIYRCGNTVFFQDQLYIEKLWIYILLVACSVQTNAARVWNLNTWNLNSSDCSDFRHPRLVLRVQISDTLFNSYLSTLYGVRSKDWNPNFEFNFDFLNLDFRRCLKSETVWKLNSYWVSEIHTSSDFRHSLSYIVVSGNYFTLSLGKFIRKHLTFD